MPESGALVAFTVLAVAIVAAPGPSVLFIVGRAMALGRRAALVTVLGNAIGLVGQVAAVAVGLGAVVERSAVAFTIVKLVGAAYLVWLGIQAIRHRADLIGDVGDALPTTADRGIFAQGLLVGIANPKSIVFFAAVLPQYVEVGGMPAGVQMLLLGFLFAGLAVVIDSLWALVAGSVRTWLADSPVRSGRLRAAGGVVMVGVGVDLALTARGE